jgi:hypothetical protein
MRIVPLLTLTALSALILGQGCPPSPPGSDGGDVTAPATLSGTVNVYCCLCE